MSTRELWARTTLFVWPEDYVLVSLPREQAARAAQLVGAAIRFAALVLERDEVSLTLPAKQWKTSDLRTEARAEHGPFRAITFDIDLEPDICGYLAPAAQRLAEAGVSIIPQCGFLKDHLLVPADKLDAARHVLAAWIEKCRVSGPD